MATSTDFVPADQNTKYPGTYIHSNNTIDEVYPRIQPGLNIDFSNHLDGDLSQRRTLTANTAVYFDPQYAPQGSVSYTASLTHKDKKQLKMSANYINNLLFSDISFKPTKRISFQTVFMLAPTMPLAMPLKDRMGDDYSTSVVYKGDEYSLTSSVNYKSNTTTVSLSFLRMIYSGFSMGSMITSSFGAKPASDLSLLLKFKKYKFSDVYQMAVSKKEASLAFMKNINKNEKWATKLSYNFLRNKPHWWVGYTYDFQDSGTRISAAIDSELKSTVVFGSRIGNLPISASVCGEVDFDKGQHKLGLVIQAYTLSKEEESTA